MHDQDINLIPRFPLGFVCLFIFVAILFGLMICSIHKDVTVIDTRVETVDGKIYDCADASSYDNGMTYIRKPYQKIIIPTKSIKIITEIK